MRKGRTTATPGPVGEVGMGPVRSDGLLEDRVTIPNEAVTSAKPSKPQKPKRRAERRPANSPATSEAALPQRSDLAASTEAPQSLIDRYHAMAEELNGRGAMELAVPFYRQTIALLLAERDQLRASADVKGVLAAAAQLHQEPGRLDADELSRRVGALEEELCAGNAQEVAAALEALEERWPEPHAQLLGLRAKLQLLAGDLAEARRCFETALELDPDCLRLRMNTGAARLATGAVGAALDLLRPLAQERDALEAEGAEGSLWNNLAQAELQAGEVERALACLTELLAHDPALVDPDLWTEQGCSWLQSGEIAAAEQLVSLLRPVLPDAHRARLLPALADALEAQGAYRQAALLYRELLRPSLSA